MPTKAKINSSVFRHVEYELRSYWETRNEIKRIRDEIISMNPYEDDGNVGGSRGNLPGDPTGRKATALLMNRRLEYLERVAGAIRVVYDQLPAEKKRMVQLRYWANPPWQWNEIAEELEIGRTTAWRWNQEIVTAIAERLGWM